jgi:hypothetical protein
MKISARSNRNSIPSGATALAGMNDDVRIGG